MLSETTTAPDRAIAPNAPTAGIMPSFAFALLAFSALYAVLIAPILVSGNSPAIAATAVLAAALITLSAWDATTLRLPDAITLPLIVLGIAIAPPDAMAWRALSAFAAGCILFAIAVAYKRIRHRDGLGLGDVKLVAAAGAWIGLENLSGVLLIACASAILTLGALTLLNRQIKLTDSVAFGPFLALGLWMVWLYDPIAALAM